jgi:hypothetical protein
MEAILQEYLIALSKSEYITIHASFGKLVFADASNEVACALINQQFAQHKKILVIAEPVWLLKYMAIPPLDFDEWWSTDTPTLYRVNNVVDIATNAHNDDGTLYIFLAQEDVCYALLKRFRKPLYGVIAEHYKGIEYIEE